MKELINKVNSAKKLNRQNFESEAEFIGAFALAEINQKSIKNPDQYLVDNLDNLYDRYHNYWQGLTCGCIWAKTIEVKIGN